MVFTIINPKVCNAATNTAFTMKCYVRGLTLKDFNNLSIKNIENLDAFKFGLSILHARIRFFEFLLHLLYHSPIKNGKREHKRI